MAGIKDQLKQLEGQLAFLLEDSTNNRLKLFSLERELKGTKDKLGETEKKLEETEKKREKAERELHEHFSMCQPNLERSASSTEEMTIREQMIELGNKIDHTLGRVNIINNEMNELKESTASMSRQLRQVTAPDNQCQPKANQGLPMATTGQAMATTGQANALQGQTNASQGRTNASQGQAMAVVKPHYYSSVCSNIDVDHTTGILRYREDTMDAAGIFKSARPLSQQCSSFSVEITGRGKPSSLCVAIGLAGKKWDGRVLCGFGSVAYWDDGDIVVSDLLQRDPRAARLRVWDIMKTNVTFSPRLSVQFYKNGREVFNHSLQAADFRQKKLYPVVTLLQRGTSVRLLDADAWKA